MPGGFKNINGSDGKKFTADRQPANRGRKPVKFLTTLLTRELKSKKDITIDGIDVVTGKPTKIRINMPTREVIVQALLRQAAKGNMIAIKEVFDRIEGKAPQPLVGGEGGAIEVSTTLLQDIADKINGEG